MRFKLFAALLISSLAPYSASVCRASAPRQFSHINTANSSLSYDGVSRMMQDSRGFIWIGTFKGLDRYDGRNMELFSKKDLGLDSDFIHVIIEDRRGDLWIGTDTGVSRYIYEKNRFERFDKVSDNGATIRNKVTDIYMDSLGRIWIVANYQGVFRYDPSDGSLVNFRDEDRGWPEYNTDRLTISIRRIVEDGEGGFWISKYHNGLFHCNGDLSSISMIQTVNDKQYFLSDEIERMFTIEGKLVVASGKNGISRYDPLSRTVENLFRLPGPVTLVDASLEQDRWIWLCTNDGLWRYDLAGIEDTEHIVPDNSDMLSIKGKYVFTSLVDRDGGLWVGTKDGGVSFCSASQKNVTKCYKAGGELLTDCLVTSFACDGGSTVWVTTEQSGLLRYDTGSGTLSKMHFKGIPQTLSCACCDNEGQLWLGSLDGIFRLDPESGKVRSYGPVTRVTGPADPRIYLICKSPDGELWLSNTLGLYRYDRNGDNFVQIHAFDGVFVTSLAWAPDSTVWVSSYATGLFHWNPVNGSILNNYRAGDGSGLPSDKISSVFIDSEGKAWAIGFSDGVARLDKDRFTVFNSTGNKSMLSDVFFTALQDNDGDMWFTSDKGLMRMDPPEGETSMFSSLDGLLEDKLSKSAMMLPDGRIFLGSDNGFSIFDPSTFKTGLAAPEVIVTEMNIGDGTYDGNVDIADHIELESGSNSFGFRFSAMNLSVPSANHVRVMLEGYDNGWKDVSASRSAFYFNVPRGSYRLRIASSSTGYGWEERHIPIGIKVKPPFLLSFPGILLIAFGVMSMAAAAIILINIRQKRRTRRQEEEFKKKAEDELFLDKLNFFSHIVHEIKTPLTLIRTPLQSIMTKDRIDEESRYDLQVMKSNTEYLTSLVNELLEFVRIERKGYVLDRQPINLAERIRSILFNYSDTAFSRGIGLKFDPETEVWVSADAPALDKILNNILINSLKYACREISVELSEKDGTAYVNISNDGETIPEEFRDEIFKPFVQYHKDQSGLRKGIGIGLPLARSLALMHSGDLVLCDDSRTSFGLSLPSIPAPDRSVQRDEETLPYPSENGNAILLVDDNESFREFLQKKLEGEYTVLTAGNGDAALKILQENDVNLVITDVSMPGMDGLTLCRNIRQDMENSHLPIVILSARISVESKIQAMEAGADLYFEKPFDLEYLRSSIRSILERRALLRVAVGQGIGDFDISRFGLPKCDEEFFNKFDRIVSENLGYSELSNEFVAEKLCMSQSTLERKIRKMLNTSPKNYIRTKRLSLAARMLKDAHGNSVTDICYATGFTNVSYFAKCFKEQFGVNPSEY